MTRINLTPGIREILRWKQIVRETVILGSVFTGIITVGCLGMILIG